MAEFGYHTEGSTFHNHGGSAVYADRHTYSPAENGVLDSIFVFCRKGSAGTIQGRFALYDASDDTLVAETVEINITYNSGTYYWNEAAVVGSVDVYAAKNYYFAFKQNDANYVKCNSGTLDHWYDFEAYANAWVTPGNWTVESGKTNKYSVYATYTPSGVDVTVYPDALALALTQETPTIAWDSSVLPTTLALALIQETATVEINYTALSTTLTLALTQPVPTILFPVQTALPATLALVLTLPSPEVVAGTIVTPNTLALVSTLETSTVLFPIQTILPTTLALALTQPVFSLSFDYVVAVSTLELALTQSAPTVGSFCTVTPGTLSLTVTLEVSSVAVSFTVLPDCFLLVVDLPPPTVLLPTQTILPTTLALALTQHVPAVQKENDFSSDPNCAAVWNMEDGELTTDSKGTNTLTNSGVNVSTSDFKQGGASGDFWRVAGDVLSILDGNLDSGFPLKSGESNKTFSFAFWFKSDDITDTQYLITKPITGKYSFAVYISGSKITLAISSNGTTWGFIETHASTLSTGIWYHVGITYNASDDSYRIRIWDDNAQAILGTDKTGTATDINISDSGFYLSWPSLSLALGGHMDEVVVFSDVLSVVEIDAIRSKLYSLADILPDVFALALTQHAPTVGPFQIIEPSTFALALAQPVPTVEINVTCLPATLQLALTQETPTVALPIQTILPDVFALALTLQTPIVTAGNIVMPDVFALALTQETAIPQVLQTILPTTLTLALTLETPTVAAGQVLIAPNVLDLRAALLTPAVIIRYVEMPPAMHEALIDPYKGGAWLWLVELDIPGYDVIRLARNTEDTIYAGLTFEKSNLDVGRYSLSGEGSIPQVMLRVAQDGEHVLEDIINETEGAGDGSAKLIRTHEDFLDSAVTSLEATFDILTSESSTEWITFVLGIPSPLLKKIPIRIYSSKICPYAVPTLFKGPECQYSGEDIYCTGKYDDCLAKGNTNHWGSEIGLDPNTARI